MGGIFVKSLFEKNSRKISKMRKAAEIVPKLIASSHKGKLHFVVRFCVKPGMKPQFYDVFEPAIKATHAEKGCIAYQLHEDFIDENVVWMLEEWESLDAVKSHMQAAHTQKLLGGALEPFLSEELLLTITK